MSVKERAAKDKKCNQKKKKIESSYIEKKERKQHYDKRKIAELESIRIQ